MTTTPPFYVNGQPYTPGPNEKHLLAATPNGGPTCICGYTAPGAPCQMEAVSLIQKHVRENGAVDPAGDTPSDPWATFGQPRESIIVTRLRTGREKAWPELQPAFDVAILLAKQAEYEAERASTIAMTGIEPAHSPLVQALAESVEAPPTKDPWAPEAHQ
jgi:hypothetical protein